MSEIEHPEVKHLEQRIQNTETAVINLNTKFDKMENNVNDKFDKLLAHSDTQADKLYTRLSDYKDSKQITTPILISVFTILIIIVGAGFSQYSNIAINEVKHEYVAKTVDSFESRLYNIELDRFTAKQGIKLQNRVDSLDKDVAVLNTLQNNP